MSSTTVHVSICSLRRAATIHGSRPRLRLARRDRPRTSPWWRRHAPNSIAWSCQNVLIEAGLTLIQEAEHSQTMTKLAQATQVRNGLMVAMLGFRPIRRKNFAALEIGRSLVKIRGRWWIVLSAAETKENRADERRVNKLLIPFIDRYLDQYRPVLIRPDSPPSALWLSSRHAARIADKYVATLIGATTLSTVGVKLSPHLFRTSAASAAAVYGGDNPYLGSAVLHQRRSARHVGALQSRDKSDRRGKFPANHSAVREKINGTGQRQVLSAAKDSGR